MKKAPRQIIFHEVRLVTCRHVTNAFHQLILVLTGDNKTPKKMDYTKWKSGHPAGYSSMALVHNNTANRVRWEGVWLGSASQYPRHAYPFICERRARRECCFF